MIRWIPELLADSWYALLDTYRISIIWLVPLVFAAAFPVPRVKKRRQVGSPERASG